MKPLYYRTITPLAQLVARYHLVVATALLALMFGLGVTSMAHDSAIIDEVAHIPSAYSYLHYGDYRLNPEHPPLIKDLAGIPLQFMNLKFPTDEPGWATEVNGQWDTGWNFLYHIGNNAQEILFWARLPILLLAIAFGGLLYWFCLRRYGRAVALLALFFYTLSPNIIAHSRLVTTDLGATAFCFIALITFVRWAERPIRTNFILLSLALAAAQLAKFSAALLFPFLGLVTLGLVLAERDGTRHGRLWRYTGGFIAASAMSLVEVVIFYIPHVVHMPSVVQDKLIAGSLVSDNVTGIGQFLIHLDKVTIIGKALAQYLLGLTMVFGRVVGGNVTYLNGQVRNGSFHWYFPELFALKTQIAFLILLVVAIIVVLVKFFHPRPLRFMPRLASSFRRYLAEWVLGGFAAFYFAISVAGNLNLGIRHILPVYAPLFVLVAVATVRLGRRLTASRWQIGSRVAFALLALWYGLATIVAYPSYIAYFNEFIGGRDNAYKYFSDSGVDWGQDLIRLQQYVDAHPQIQHVAVDYFGGGEPRYYFCERAYDASHRLIATIDGYDCSHSKIEVWHASNGVYTGQYIAVSETFLENDRYYAAADHRPGYGYLRARTPIAKIGGGIFLYKLY